jgi:cytochrome c biogenesis protein CcmG/thiol:disulfide interchange protein DsbE
MVRRVRLLAWTLVVLAALAVLAIVGLASSPSPTLGRLAPALPRERLAGPSPPSLATSGRSTLVVFWASWCDPCAAEAPAIESFSQSPAGRGRVIGVDWSDGLPGARSFVRRYRWSFANVRDAEGTVGNAYRLANVPTTFAIDTHGRIRATLRGPQTERSLAQALAAAGS